MMNLRENRDKMIQRTIQSIRKSSITEVNSYDCQDIKDFEYEPSEIMALFENESKPLENPKDFKDRKLKRPKKKKQESFFSNSGSYLQKKDKNEATN